MTPSINLSFSKTGNLVERLDAAKQAGFSAINLGSDHATQLLVSPLEETRQLISQIHKVGLAVDWLHAPYEKPALYEEDAEMHAVYVGAMKAAIQIASELEAKTLVVHPFEPKAPKDLNGDGGVDRVLMALSTLTEFAGPYGVSIAIENLDEPLSQELFGVLMQKIEKLTFCFDTGHAHLGGTWDYYLPKYMDRLSALHIHDNHGINDEHLLLGEGTIDFTAFFKMLKSHQFEGYLGQECHYVDLDGVNGPLDTARFIWDRIHRLMEAS